MKNQLSFSLKILTVFIVSNFYFVPAHATLGESPDSIDAKDRGENGKAYPKHRVLNFSSAYTVHQIESTSNNVREYVSTSNTVFAICWNGISPPDLSPLLGTYNFEYQQALKQNPRQPGARNLAIKGDHVSVSKWGHMGNLQGCAVDASLIPAGVNTNELK